MLSHLTIEELSGALDAVVDEMLERCALKEPPIDAFQAAEALGITVALDDCQQGRGRYVRFCSARSSGQRTTILLRSDPREERRQWALAHELGEHTAYRVFALLGVDPRETSPSSRETVADQLACRLLVPSRWFAEDGGACDWDLFALKRRYRTASHELIARRMLHCAPGVIITIFDQGRMGFRRSNIAGRVPPLLSEEMEVWRVVHERNIQQETILTTHSIRCWPIHEEHWKREIMRTELSDAQDYNV
ncbi:MAG: ImmA/IrrE family metallo-endopeptidase [Thermoguttaceae bacterium]